MDNQDLTPYLKAIAQTLKDMAERLEIPLEVLANWHEIEELISDQVQHQEYS